MDHRAIIDKQISVHSFLKHKRIKEALDLLAGVLKDTRNGELIDTHYNLEITYKNLLHYTVAGVSDPERQKIYTHLLTEIFKLADEVFLNLFTRYGKGLFCELRRVHEREPAISFATQVNTCLVEMERHQLMNSPETPYSQELTTALTSIFELMVAKPEIYRQQDGIEKIFSATGIPWERQCVLVGALTIHLLNFYNLDATILLFNLTSHDNRQVKLRAVAGLLLVLYKHDGRLLLDGTIQKRLGNLDKHLKDMILPAVILQIIRTRETEKIAKKITDELLPEVVRMQPNLRNRLDLDNILGESLMEGKNPDWENFLSDSPALLDKLEEFSKLQMEGADLFISTFKMLKHFNFFDHAENWFLPFTYPGPVVNEILKNEDGPFKNPDLLSAMSESGVLCNSDKHSLVLSIPMMPSIQKEMMGHMFMADLEASREIEKSDQLVNVDKLSLSITNSYIQDLYRFFRIYGRRGFEPLEDPFSWSLDFHNKWFIQQLFPENEFLLKLGDYLFEKDHFAEALEVFNMIASSEPASMQILQKRAFCNQQLQQYEVALELYLQADLFGHRQAWNLKKIAYCYKALKKFNKALEYYLEAETVDPANLHTQVNIGHCHFEEKNYTEALKYYFKVEYLDPLNKKVWRPIVWCSFALGKFEQAEKYSAKTLNDNPNQHDFMNMGHVKWCKGNRNDALEWYQKCVTFPGNSRKEFFEAFANDTHLLISHEVDEQDIPIMLDQLRYYLDS